ncbi:MAG: 50S ribosomal protein L13 [Deltaproteobacteria bacterium]|nr:50S ribosomal protein L13 [Deltaproteobacteria bacterium]
MKTFNLHKEDLAPGKPFAHQWLLVDVQGQTLGRAATRIATLLRGKHKPHFTPHLDTGDFVVVVNAEKIKLTGAKLKDKFYFHHTRYPGGVKVIHAEKLLNEKPTELMRQAVKRMLPKNALNRGILETKLKLYVGPEHPHKAQQPVPTEL